MSDVVFNVASDIRQFQAGLAALKGEVARTAGETQRRWDKVLGSPLQIAKTTLGVGSAYMAVGKAAKYLAFEAGELARKTNPDLDASFKKSEGTLQSVKVGFDEFFGSIRAGVLSGGADLLNWVGNLDGQWGRLEKRLGGSGFAQALRGLPGAEQVRAFQDGPLAQRDALLRAARAGGSFDERERARAETNLRFDDQLRQVDAMEKKMTSVERARFGGAEVRAAIERQRVVELRALEDRFRLEDIGQRERQRQEDERAKSAQERDAAEKARARERIDLDLERNGLANLRLQGLVKEAEVEETTLEYQRQIAALEASTAFTAAEKASRRTRLERQRDDALRFLTGDLPGGPRGRERGLTRSLSSGFTSTALAGQVFGGGGAGGGGAGSSPAVQLAQRQVALNQSQVALLTKIAAMMQRSATVGVGGMVLE